MTEPANRRQEPETAEEQEERREPAAEGRTGQTEARNEAERTERKGIRNRDIELLESIFFIMQDIRSLEHRSEWQSEHILSTTRRLTGMPGGGGLPQGFDSTLCEVEELNRLYGETAETYIRELRKAERILNGIKDRRLKTFVRMLYVDGIRQGEICRELNLSEYQFARAREAVEQAGSMKEVFFDF